MTYRPNCKPAVTGFMAQVCQTGLIIVHFVAAADSADLKPFDYREKTRFVSKPNDGEPTVPPILIGISLPPPL